MYVFRPFLIRKYTLGREYVRNGDSTRPDRTGCSYKATKVVAQVLSKYHNGVSEFLDSLND